MQLTTDKFEITYLGALIYDYEYEKDEFIVTFLDINKSCSVEYDYSKNCITLIQAVSSDMRICEDSRISRFEVYDNVDKFNFELRSIFKFMHDLGYYVQEDIC